MHKCFLLLLTFACFLSHAQESGSTGQKLAYFSTSQAVHFEGSAGSAFGVQTVHGATLKGWALGGGIGLDLYRMRSFPVFAQLKRSLPLKRIPLYVYAEGGPNFIWARKGEELQGNNAQTKKGYYWDAGLQYHAPLRNKTSLVFSAGFGEKTYIESFTMPFWCGTPDCPQINSAFDYKFRRLALKAGFGF